MHNPIVLNDISLTISHKICFEHVSRAIHAGSRIGIIGPNGSGKSSLLKIIQKLAEPTSGFVSVPDNVVFGYVPQLVHEHNQLSGGQRFNKALTATLAQHPNVLCLDEPTNHLDSRNKASLLRMLRAYQGTLLVVSHDVELLRSCVGELWHINHGIITFFSGSYDDFVREQEHVHEQQLKQLEQLKNEKKKAREALQFEQQRAARSKRAHKQENDRNIIEKMKETASATTSKKMGALHTLQKDIEQSLAQSRMQDVIVPKFDLAAYDLAPSKLVVSIHEGSCGYAQPVLQNINFDLKATERIAIQGDNGSGKSTLFKAIMHDPAVTMHGLWKAPQTSDIGHLDQHYRTLDQALTVCEVIANVVIGWPDAAIRKHLNNFLFRKNEEVMAKAATLSGGERVRLSLALIAASNPKLLLLDEITNNLDMQTKEHVIQVLKAYPGAMIVISHDEHFLGAIGIDRRYKVENGILLQL